MGKNPSIIFRELYRKAKNKEGMITSLNGSNKPYEMGKEDGCYYVPYKEVVRDFLVEGYTEGKAIKHIDQWVDYDLVFIRFSDGYKYVGFSKRGI